MVAIAAPVMGNVYAHQDKESLTKKQINISRIEHIKRKVSKTYLIPRKKLIRTAYEFVKNKEVKICVSEYFLWREKYVCVAGFGNS